MRLRVADGAPHRRAGRNPQEQAPMTSYLIYPLVLAAVFLAAMLSAASYTV